MKKTCFTFALKYKETFSSTQYLYIFLYEKFFTEYKDNKINHKGYKIIYYYI